jgi:ribosome biogenesis protein BMS1
LSQAQDDGDDDGHRVRQRRGGAGWRGCGCGWCGQQQRELRRRGLLQGAEGQRQGKQRRGGRGSDDGSDSGSDDGSDDDGDGGAASDDSEAERERIRARKAAQKAQFDAAYDKQKSKRNGSGSESDGEGGADTDGDGDGDGDGDAEGEGLIVSGGHGSKRVGGKRELKKTEFALTAPKRANPDEAFKDETAAMKARLAGHGPGVYVRVVLSNMPAEFIKYLNPALPIVMGGIVANEHGETLLRARIKKHRYDIRHSHVC